MSDWDAAAELMDDRVDEALSDTISYSVDGGNAYDDLPGFIIPYTEGLGINEIDTSLGTRWRVKIRKALVPAISRTHRLMHPKLGDGVAYRPAGEAPDDQGRYWLFDIQKAG